MSKKKAKKNVKNKAKKTAKKKAPRKKTKKTGAKNKDKKKTGRKSSGSASRKKTARASARTAKNFRALTRKEIQELEANGCTATKWKDVRVAGGFRPDRVRDAHFSGSIRLGAFAKSVECPGGVQRPTGITHATLHNCQVGDDVLIRNVGQYIANYDIEDGAVIDNVDCLVVDGESTFGNGTEVEAVNEGGGREVMIYDRLSSQVAYLLALYRHRPELVRRLEAMITAHVSQVKSRQGTVGTGARLVNCGTLENLRVGPGALVDGAVRLQNGTINSDPADPAVVGEGVIAEDFITTAGSKVTSGALLTGCFIGQGAKVGRQYSAENTLLFANAEAFHGEGVAVFGGPYTVTHHKSTLLIAGLFSFYNAGSGSNQSNHMYKLGPVHQGIVERGSKTGSFSYLLWSCRLGAFSVVIGKHYSKFDTTDLPFSYIMENKGQSALIPAINLFTVGTRRDGAKWPKRDRRKTDDKLDLIHFDVFNPYTVSRMIAGRRRLRELDAQADADADVVPFQGVQLPRKRLQRGAESYDLAIKAYLGQKIAERLESAGKHIDDLRAVLSTDSTGTGPWVDLCGLLAPARAVEDLLKAITKRKIQTLDALETALHDLYLSYGDFEWSFVVTTWLAEIGKSAAQVTPADVAQALRDWQEATATLNDRVRKDGSKEFGDDVKIGFGMDGDAAAKEADFEAVRGTLKNNPFAKELAEDTQDVGTRVGKLLSALGQR